MLPWLVASTVVSCRRVRVSDSAVFFFFHFMFGIHHALEEVSVWELKMIVQGLRVLPTLGEMLLI